MNAPVRVGHWRELPLSPGGRALVEASAGTGKTWTIGVLYLRLLLEPMTAPGVEQVVVTTFTEAAAQELRERLRQRLRDTLALAEAGGTPTGAGDDLDWLRGRWSEPARRIEDRRRLRLALADFDRAPVGTLHALCQRILAEHPFESGSRFDTGEPTSGQALAEELARDAWRVLHQGGEDFPEGIAEDKLTLAGFTAQLKRLMAPGVRVEVVEPDAVRAGLPPGFAEGLRRLADEKSSYLPRKVALGNALRELADYLEGRSGTLRASALPHLRALDLAQFLRPDRVAAFAADPALQALPAWLPAIEASLHAPLQRFWRRQVEQAGRWRDERLAARGQITFDEMIRRAHAAMVANPALADALHAAWPVALVDEFQDTDALQYGILDRLYRDAEGSQRGRLVMIGDPKQAIYGFRGGDIHAYRRARSDAGHVLALDTNHRSSRAYVAAVNQWFAAAGTALGGSDAEDVAYLPVAASDRRDGEPCTVDGVPLETPLQVHFQAQDPGSQPERRRAALLACADHIARLLASGGMRLGGEHLQPGDVAVLLPKNDDIAALRAMLHARGVPCVGGARDSVFAGDMAFELHVLLAAVLAENDESALRAALLTRLWGGDLAMLAALSADSPAWTGVAARLHALRRRWQAEGVLSLVLQIAADAAPRLLAGAGGERELADLRHLGELLQQRAERGGGARELLAWLRDQRSGEDDEDASEERERRLESDAARVRLMTLHKAKGLEFPVVFLPLMWAHEGRSQKTPFLVPLPGGGRLAAFDDAAKALARREDQDERYRVWYVALTRAIHACHVYALEPQRPSGNSPQPKADPDRSPLDAMVARIREAGVAPGPNIRWSDAGWPAGAPPRLPSAAPAAPRQARPEPPATPLRQRLSFSSLVGGQRHAATDEAPADDEPLAVAPDVFADLEATTAGEPPHPDLLALAGVRGPAFGNAVHAAFEHRAYGQPFATQLALLARELQAFGVRPREGRPETLVPALAARLDAALAAEILPGLRLGGLPPGAQRAEMAFHFALDAARLSRLRAACAAHGEPGLVPPLALESLRGLMTGKIDLVFEHAGRFHVLDYKGNWLGERLADYMGPALRRAMDQHHYRLQALLYTVALHRLLRQRVADYSPAAHLGGIVYLFVRAAGLAPGSGVHEERFPDALLLAVDEALAATGAPV